MQIDVRKAVPDDAAAVARILAASYPVLMAGAYEPRLLAIALPIIGRPHPGLLASGTYYLAEAGGEAVGCGGWSWHRPGTDQLEPGLGHIRHFATAAGWTGRGVGRALIERCVADGRAAGVERFECLASLNGEGFYAALGFERIARVEVAMGPIDFPSILMVRDLGSAVA